MMKTFRGIIGLVIGIMVAYGLYLVWQTVCFLIQMFCEIHLINVDTTAELVSDRLRNIFGIIENIPMIIFTIFIILTTRFNFFWKIIFWVGVIIFSTIGVFQGIEIWHSFDDKSVLIPMYGLEEYGAIKNVFATIVAIGYPLSWGFLFANAVLGWKIATYSPFWRLKSGAMVIILGILLLIDLLFFMNFMPIEAYSWVIFSIFILCSGIIGLVIYFKRQSSRNSF